MHRPCLSVFCNLDRAWAMFRSTMVTGYPGWSGSPWLGELVIRSTVVYGRGEISKFVVVRWAYIKELATSNTGRDGIRGLLGCV